MKYPDAAAISQSYALTQRLIHRLTNGLSHADSLVQPPFEANCLNWVVGHIIAGRNEALGFLEMEPVWGEEELARYRTGSPAITGPEQALTLERLLADLDLSQERIAAVLGNASADTLAAVVETRFGPRPLGEHLAGLHWHETYHLGQLELLRQLRS